MERRARRWWPQDAGTLVVLPDGYEDDQAWHVVVGAREWLVDQDPDYVLLDAPAWLVSKSTGRLELATVVEVLDRLERMRPVSVTA